jgi:Carboxypeptidase regulatory-like domain
VNPYLIPHRPLGKDRSSSEWWPRHVAWLRVLRLIVLAICRSGVESLTQFRRLVLLSVGVLFLASVAYSQQPNLFAPIPPLTNSQQTDTLASGPQGHQETSSIAGEIVDQSGASIAGAVVKLTRDGQPSPPDTTSNEDGLFAFTHVSPGPFHLTVSSAGLASQEFSDTLQSGQAYVTPIIVMTIPTQVMEVRVGLPTFEIAQQQLKEQEKQRVLGIIPDFYVTYVRDAAPLTPKQKFELAWKSASDPITLVGVGTLAGIDQAADRWGAYGQGAQGYAKRFGATYANVFGATFIGGAIMPSILKQDPRYFYKGTGSKRSRLLYAVASSFICRGDNGRWQPNYSNIAGSFGGAGLEALYLPKEDRRGSGFVFSAAAIRLGETSLAGIMQEFVVPKLMPHHPTRSHY